MSDEVKTEEKTDELLSGNFVERMEVELAQLQDRVDRLNKFMTGKTAEDFEKLELSPLEQHLMSVQLMNMTGYMIVLSDRLAIIKGKLLGDKK